MLASRLLGSLGLFHHIGQLAHVFVVSDPLLALLLVVPVSVRAGFLRSENALGCCESSTCAGACSPARRGSSRGGECQTTQPARVCVASLCVSAQRGKKAHQQNTAAHCSNQRVRLATHDAAEERRGVRLFAFTKQVRPGRIHKCA